MDHKVVFENSSSAAEYYFLFEGHKLFEYQTETYLLSES